MSNISDYLEWRGDLSFVQAPFNAVDNLILSYISYVNLKGIVPGIEDGGSITLRQACETFFDKNDEEKLKADRSFIKDAPFLLKNAAKTRRFGELILSDYEDIFDENNEEQFCAFHIRIDKKTVFIVFRGTDDSLIGWKEDFNLSFISPIPAQKEAAFYVNKTVDRTIQKLILGGHSKGGNLAIYAAVFSKKTIRRKIETIYNNDGPGFDRQFIESSKYQEIVGRVISILPQDSFVGMLLEHAEEIIVVKATSSGIMQHNALTWQVKGDFFETTDKVSESSRRLNMALKRWINNIDKEERSRFVETLFSLVITSGAKNLSEISTIGFKNIGNVIAAYTALDKESKAMIRRILRSLTGEVGRIHKEKPVKQ